MVKLLLLCLKGLKSFLLFFRPQRKKMAQIVLFETTLNSMLQKQDEEEEEENKPILLELYEYTHVKEIVILPNKTILAVINGHYNCPIVWNNTSFVNKKSSNRNQLCYLLKNTNSNFIVTISQGTCLQEILAHPFIENTLGYVSLKDIIQSLNDNK